MTIRVNSPAAWRGRLVKVASIEGSTAEIVWINERGDIQARDVWLGDLVSFEEATRTQSNWGAAAAEESNIRSWRAAD
ncbi:hypothetical protein [Bradyrhizobium sp. LB11.1]|uniref:hypothetical protein n=1 Tax=Bradyrhizobium sp. LB11.1 TaxID=3156326 RepID=UPI0033957F17